MPKYESIVESRPQRRKLSIRFPGKLYADENYPFNRAGADPVYFRIVHGNESALDVYKLAMFGTGAAVALEDMLLLAGEVLPFANQYTRSAVLRIPESGYIPFKPGDRVSMSVIELDKGLRIEKIR